MLLKDIFKDPSIQSEITVGFYKDPSNLETTGNQLVQDDEEKAALYLKLLNRPEEALFMRFGNTLWSGYLAYHRDSDRITLSALDQNSNVLSGSVLIPKEGFTSLEEFFSQPLLVTVTDKNSYTYCIEEEIKEALKGATASLLSKLPESFKSVTSYVVVENTSLARHLHAVKTYTKQEMLDTIATDDFFNGVYIQLYEATIDYSIYIVARK